VCQVGNVPFLIRSNVNRCEAFLFVTCWGHNDGAPDTLIGSAVVIVEPSETIALDPSARAQLGDLMQADCICSTLFLTDLVCRR
jgi:hypothetical protein